jgi:ATP-dependent DNA helicase RecG
VTGVLTLRDLAEIEVARLASVGPKLEARLAQMGLTDALRVLEHYPRRYVDRTHRADIADLEVGEEATIVGEVRRVSGRRTRHGRALVEASVHDGTAFLAVTFFNQSWREQQLSVGTQAAFFGKLDVYRGQRRMTNPAVDVLRRAGEAEDYTGEVVAIYPQSGKADVSSWQIRRVVGEVLRRCEARGIADPLPEGIRDELDLCDRASAYRMVHTPESFSEQVAARRRLVFDEFLRMQVGLVARKRAFESEHQGVAHRGSGALVAAFHAALPFPLTGDQRAAVDVIAADMARATPMHRLLQGDVGSGKTVVALSALLAAVEAGSQGALLAPTEVLAEQHVLACARLLDGLEVDASASSLFGRRPVSVVLLTNRTTAAERRRINQELAAGAIDIVVGTHALLYETVQIPRLGAVVIDEQHRFGVEQRSALRERGVDGAIPDVLVMTATPIPRTAGMLIYGDLDKSELRELPPGRTPITTEVVGESPLDRERAYSTLRAEVEAGRQAYVVCPLVDGSDKVQAKAVTEEFGRLAAEELAGLRLGLLHGQLPSADKESVMQAFRARELDVLVATTVIEVGVDVPNATVMIIEDADRFGLSQLHQLRGRVGRGVGESWCFLLAAAGTDDARERLAAMEASTDGFLLAEKDLEIRGAGEVFGERQSGFSDLKLGRIPRDEAVVVAARGVAEQLLDDDPHLDSMPGLREEVEDLLGDNVEFLFKS